MKNQELKILKKHPDAQIPFYATPGSAGFDLRSIESVVLEPGETKLIKTGLAFGIPDGFEVQIRPRSSIALKTKLRIVNSPGTLDSDYIGEVCIIMQNTGDVHSFIEKNERIAQAVMVPIINATFQEVTSLSPTERNDGGFGSTGRL